ncbi:hypothetical protein [Nocardia sp. BMG111209]|uniref:hypothetical protein n=1 Tax=Nocardia sp. BMG111209 TaxID=1160137 RepID=UPI00036485FB|nr:hypothetical protein [Nocardia sp. BMG111209]
MSKFTRSFLAALAVAYLSFGPVPWFGPAPARADEPTLIMLGYRDDGRTIAAGPGDLVRVLLVGGRDEQGAWAWDTPVSADPAVLRQHGGRAPQAGTAESIFTAVGPGSGTLVSARSCVPEPGTACPDPVPWQVTVVVR